MKLLQKYAFTVVTIATIFSLIYLFLPNIRAEFIEEDRFIENLTAILFFIAFSTGFLFLLSLRSRKEKLIYIFIPFISLLAFLSEISFGIRIFKIDNSKLPKLNGTEMDGVHDIILIGYKSLKEFINKDNYWLFALIGIICTLLLIAVIWKYRSLISIYPPFLFVLLAVGFLILATSVDLSILDAILTILSVQSSKIHHYLLFLEELSEMFVALSLVFSSFAIKLEGARKNTINLQTQ